MVTLEASIGDSAIVAFSVNATSYFVCTRCIPAYTLVYGSADGYRTKSWRTKWYGQNDMDKMVQGQNGIGHLPCRLVSSCVTRIETRQNAKCMQMYE